MYPTLARLFDEPLPAYFTLLMTGFGMATFLAVRWSRRARLDHDVIIDLALISVLLGVAGGRILHVIADGYFWDYVHLCTDPGLVIHHVATTAAECGRLGNAVWTEAGECRAAERDCLAWAEFWNGGLAYYGGLITASAGGVWFLRKEGFPVGKGCDIVGAVIPLGIFFGRMGCFFGGCCFGVVTDHPLGLHFPGGSPASLAHSKAGLLPHRSYESLAVHPTQLYEALGCLAISAALLVWLHPRKRFDGQVMLAFLGLYAALRFGLEYLRDDERGALLGVSTSQFIGILIVVGCGIYWKLLARRPSASPSAG